MSDGLKDKHRRAIIDILFANERVQRAVLFGSRAMETFTTGSDVDLALFGDALTLTDHAKLAEAIEGLSIPQRVDLLLHKTITSEKLLEHIQRHGVEWFKKTFLMRSDWKPYRLGDLVQIIHGFAFKSANFSDKPTNDILITPGNFAIGGGFKQDKFKYYDGHVPEEYVLSKNDLLVTMTDLSKESDTLGYPAFVPENPGKRYLHNQRLGKVEIQNDSILDKQYLFYLLCSDEYRNEVIASATGTTVKHTAPKRISSFRFRLPTRNEQGAIGFILKSFDDKIELNRRMNRTLEKMAQAIFKSWFIDFDPVRAKAEGRDTGLPQDIADLFPDTFEDSELGEIPKGWKASIVKTGFNVTMGQSPPGSTYNERGEGLPFFQGRRDFGFRYPTKRIYCTEPKRLANDGDTLISVRAPVGDINMAYEHCCVGRGVAAIRHKSGNRSFTYYSMHALGERFSRFEGEGTVFGSINKSAFDGLPYISPNKSTIDAFENKVGILDDILRTNSEETINLAKTRDALLPKLISGELRIPDVKKILEGVE